jgi:hexosaminidase
MPYPKILSHSLYLLIVLVACNTAREPELSRVETLIPKPASVSAGSGLFTLTAQTGINTLSNQPELQRLAVYLSELLKPATGFAYHVSMVGDKTTPGHIYLALSGDSTLGAEGYTLDVTPEQVKLAAHQPAGLFRGIQTLRQLLPAAIESSTAQQATWEIPAVAIRDQPTYAYRGSMLDVARHFFSVEDVKRYIDLIAAYKMNVLHLHLSDDQGWRIEIKSWPKLTEIGGSTQVGGGTGGFYTQEQYNDIVRYAADRYVTIIPEIDMPGHTNAALASYPELNCNDTATKLYSGIEVGFSSLCTNKPVTYKFLDDVIRELSELTPGPYIHIGGDESHATKKEDYIPFMNKVQPMVTKYGKTVIGWDEIALSTLLPNTIVQYWADAGNSREAVRQGAKVIMSPARKAYLDMQYDSTTKLGLHWAAYIEVDTAYIWDPAKLETGISRENIVGIEAPLWTETIIKMDDIEYMVFPRLPGFAEIGWSPDSGRNWDEYKKRLGAHGTRFKAMGIDYHPSKLVPWKE